uniref:Sorting nexin-25 n=1 Tax=Anopheles minimus TaxID=112268 RepID=A0A182VT22_9DIPT
MTHSEPCTKYLENNRMTVYQNIYMQLVSLWDSANCDSCASAVNETAQFMNLSATLDKCFANTTNPCAACDTDYQNVQQFYAGMEKKRHGSGMCFDIEDRMNQTRRVWSGQYNCCKDKRRSMVVFASIASVVCVLPFVFYTLMHVVTIRRDSHRISLLSATSVNDESGQPSSSGANNIVQRNSEMERIVEADDNEEDHENSDNDYDGDSIPKKVAFLAPISNLNNLDVKEAVFGTIYVHYKLTNRESVPYVNQGQDDQTNVLYNATRSPISPGSSPTSRIFGGRGTSGTGSGSVSGAAASTGQLPIIFGRTVDGLLQQIIDNTMRDLVGPALETVVANPRRIVELLREDVWLGIEKLHERAARIDAPKLIACDFVQKVTLHLQKIRRTAKQETSPDAFASGANESMLTPSYLASVEKELEFLKKISEILIIFLLPRGYSLSPVKDLLSEVIAYRVLHPAIRYMTAPDFINQQIVECIETRLVAVAIQKRSHEYAANFEDFLRIIDMTQTTEELHSIRASIVSDIRQATTMQAMQRARGGFAMPPCDTSGSSGASSTAENGTHCDGEPAATLRLKRYIQQLSFAKSQCEKCLTRLGWQGSVSNDVDLSLADILSTVGGRRALTAFLEPMNAANLVGYYTTVEELRRAARSAWHQLGAEIFYTYIRAPSSKIPLDKATRKRMEAFLVGDVGGPDVFYEVQRECLALLEQKYYQPFLLSDEYMRLKNSLTQDEFKEIITSCGGNLAGTMDVGVEMSGTLQHGSHDSQDSQESSSGSANGGDGTTDPALADLSNHSQYARNKLDRLDEKLANKQQALEALKQSLKPDSKLLLMLEREIEWLRGERRQLESHLLRTAVWGEYLGSWRAIVESVDFSDDREPPQFMIVVQVDEMNDYGSSTRDDTVVMTALEATDTISTGWVVVRSLAQFHTLHRKLRPMCAELRQLDLPSNNAFKLFLLKNDRALLEKAKAQVQRYLSFILEDDHLNQSEVVYEFLSPSSDRLKQGVLTSNPSPSKKQSSKFSLATIFRSNSDKLEQLWNVGGTERPFVGDHDAFTPEDADQVSLYLEGGPASGVSSSASPSIDGSSVEARDSIAEPLYALLGEIFDLGGVFRWLRKSLISFVQITYGQTINRQLRESITALFDEPMLHAYASAILRSLWPGGASLQTNTGGGGVRLLTSERSEDEREMIMNAARSLLQDNIPELLCSLIGAQNARQGALKLFEVLQNPLYNKQLFYDLLETLMLELFPEIRQLKPAASSNSSNTTVTTSSSDSSNASVQPREYYHQPSGTSLPSPTSSPPTPMGGVGSASDESLTCNVCDRAFRCRRQLASHQQKKRHFGVK